MRRYAEAVALLLVVALGAALGATALSQGAGPPKPTWICKGTVIAIHDGDTPRVTIENPLGDAVRWLRLGSGVDCPEIDQPWGDKARDRTRDLVTNKQVVIQLTGEVTYGRPVALIWLPDGRELGAVLVEEGLAWIDPRYAKSERGRMLKSLMEQARERRVGLWADTAPIAPWEYRKKKGK